jgi:hypothetical protein
LFSVFTNAIIKPALAGYWSELFRKNLRMGQKVTREAVKRFIERLQEQLPREECRSCDCLQGFLVQLEMDATEDVADLTSLLKVDPSEMHSCLGCNPCPPAESFSEYLRKQKDDKLSNGCQEATDT